MIPSKTSLSIVSALLAIALPLSPTARADFVTAYYGDSTHFDVKITHVPDCDQRRTASGSLIGLPNDGNYYCVPTSAFDLLGYAGNHGFPEILGVTNWQSQANYNTATANILVLGILAGTNPTKGTGTKAMQDVLFNYVAPTGKLMVLRYAAAGNYAPSPKTLAVAGLWGGVSMFCYGRYSVTGQISGIDVLDRDGGHCMALARTYRNGSTIQLEARDPASPNDGMLTTQSAFANRLFNVTPRVVTTSNSLADLKVMYALEYDSGKAKNAYVDSVVVLMPFPGFAFQNTGNGAFISLLQPFKLTGSPSVPASFNFTKGLIDVIPSADLGGFYLLLDGVNGAQDELAYYDALEGKQTLIAKFTNASALAMNRMRELYVLGDGSVRRYKMTEDGTHEPIGSVNLPFACTDITTDDTSDDIVLVAPDAGRLVRYPRNLAGTPVMDLLPVPLGGLGEVEFSPTDNSIWCFSQKSPLLFKVVKLGDGSVLVNPVALPQGVVPKALEITEDGHPLVSHAGGIVELMQGAAGGWTPVPNSPWASAPQGSHLHLARSLSNYDDKVHGVPGWSSNLDAQDMAALLPAVVQVPDCDAEGEAKEYGTAKAGVLGTPHFSALTPPRLGTTVKLQIDNLFPGSAAVLFLGTSSASIPFDGGTLLVQPIISLPFSVPASSFTLGTELPADPAFCGVELYLQAFAKDPGAGGYYDTAQTNGLRLVFGS